LAALAAFPQNAQLALFKVYIRKVEIDDFLPAQCRCIEHGDDGSIAHT